MTSRLWMARVSPCLNGCDAVSDFTFQTQNAASSAATALANEVFVDGGLGLFDTDPELTTGCTDISLCAAFTPYGLDRDVALVLLTTNNQVEDFDAVTLGGVSRSRDLSILISPDFSEPGTYAKWSLSTQQPIPEPTTLLLLSSGLLALAGYRWRQGRREGQHIG